MKKVFIVFFGIMLVSCSRDPLLVCEKSKCEITGIFPGVVEISNKTRRDYFLLRTSGLEIIELPDSNTVPFAFSNDLKLMVAKTSQETSIKISIFNYPEGSLKKAVELPDNFVSILSGCFLSDNRLAFLHIDETEDLTRRYMLSISTSSEMSDFDSYLIREEDPRDFVSNYLSLGSVVERPVAIQCYNDNLSIITTTIFSDMMQMTVYNFNIEKRSLEYLTAYHPMKPESESTVFFDTAGSTLHIFNQNELISVKENNFPITKHFNESGALYFSPFSENGFLMFFVPKKLEKGKLNPRMINIGELSE